jgi:hypothetical protein
VEREKMHTVKLSVVAAALLLTAPVLAEVVVQHGSASAENSEPTDIYIRRLAGLPASTAVGEISIVDVGHMPMDTMISIVANRNGRGWHASYACAASPFCAAGADHISEEYDLPTQSSQRVDAILDKLRSGPEHDETSPGPTTVACGWLTVVISYEGLRRSYYRACKWGKDLGELETLLRPAQQMPKANETPRR